MPSHALLPSKTASRCCRFKKSAVARVCVRMTLEATHSRIRQVSIERAGETTLVPISYDSRSFCIMVFYAHSTFAMFLRFLSPASRMQHPGAFGSYDGNSPLFSCFRPWVTSSSTAYFNQSQEQTLLSRERVAREGIESPFGIAGRVMVCLLFVCRLGGHRNSESKNQSTMANQEVRRKITQATGQRTS